MSLCLSVLFGCECHVRSTVCQGISLEWRNTTVRVVRILFWENQVQIRPVSYHEFLNGFLQPALPNAEQGGGIRGFSIYRKRGAKCKIVKYIEPLLQGITQVEAIRVPSTEKYIWLLERKGATWFVHFTMHVIKMVRSKGLGGAGCVADVGS
jgi:hypothetical protein